MNEVWQSIKGYEGLYEVSNTGKVRSLDRVVRTKNGNTQTYYGKEKTLSNNGTDYYFVTLYKNNKGKRFYIHRLVYSTFVEGIPEGLTINHIDYDKSNNTVENLELMTRSENSGNTRKTVGRTVGQYDLEGKLIRTYSSPKEVRETTEYKNIYHNLKGDTKTAYGFIWKYL